MGFSRQISYNPWMISAFKHLPESGRKTVVAHFRFRIHVPRKDSRYMIFCSANKAELLAQEGSCERSNAWQVDHDHAQAHGIDFIPCTPAN